MPPLRVPCCQPRCSGKLANGKREFTTSIFTTVSADARVIAHLCQSLHCCAARHTRQPLKVLGSSPIVDAMAYGVRRTPSSRARPVGSSFTTQASPEHVGVYPVPITMPTSGSFFFTASSSAVRAPLRPFSARSSARSTRPPRGPHRAARSRPRRRRGRVGPHPRTAGRDRAPRCPLTTYAAGR